MGQIDILNVAIFSQFFCNLFLMLVFVYFIFFLLTDSLRKTTLDSSRCLAVFEKALGCCLWADCPAVDGANCFKTHRLLQLRYCM